MYSKGAFTYDVRFLGRYRLIQKNGYTFAIVYSIERVKSIIQYVVNV